MLNKSCYVRQLVLFYQEIRSSKKKKELECPLNTQTLMFFEHSSMGTFYLSGTWNLQGIACPWIIPQVQTHTIAGAPSQPHCGPIKAVPFSSIIYNATVKQTNITHWTVSALDVALKSLIGSLPNQNAGSLTEHSSSIKQCPGLLSRSWGRTWLSAWLHTTPEHLNTVV